MIQGKKDIVDNSKRALTSDEQGLGDTKVTPPPRSHGTSPTRFDFIRRHMPTLMHAVGHYSCPWLLRRYSHRRPLHPWHSLSHPSSGLPFDVIALAQSWTHAHRAGLSVCNLYTQALNRPARYVHLHLSHPSLGSSPRDHCIRLHPLPRG